jgi:hypothetical protein
VCEVTPTKAYFKMSTATTSVEIPYRFPDVDGSFSTCLTMMLMHQLGGIICQWLLLLQEFDFEVIVKARKLNARPDHLSRVTNREETMKLEDKFLDAQLFLVQIADEYFADNIQYLSTGTVP